MTSITNPSPRDWVEDFPHENGNYICGCVVCKERFIGHKRRRVCKLCHDADDAEAKSRALWLHEHKAPKDWAILTQAEVAAIKADLSRVVWDLSEERRVRADLTAAIQDIINGCCHPNIAIRRVLVPIQPLRDVLAKAAALDRAASAVTTTVQPSSQPSL